MNTITTSLSFLQELSNADKVELLTEKTTTFVVYTKGDKVKKTYLMASKKSKDVAERLEEKCKEFLTLRENLPAFQKLFVNTLEENNKLSQRIGFKEIEFLGFELFNWGADDYYFDKVSLKLNIGGEIVYHHTTGLNLMLRKEFATIYQTIEREMQAPLWTAGAIETPDYVIFNVCYNTQADLYKMKME